MAVVSISALIINRRLTGTGRLEGLISERITCQSGLSLSVQANNYAYCEPRNDSGPYSHVEVGYPSRAIEALLPYAENPAVPTETVYPYVPVGIVEAILLENGWIVS